MNKYFGRSDYVHGSASRVGILLSNIGTPDAPTAAALRTYLRDFLLDPRVIEIPRWKWKTILYAFILPTRPKKSAALYSKVWMKEGSPLLVYGNAQRDALSAVLKERFGDEVVVELGMRYGNPSMDSALRKLFEAGCDRLIVLPLFPQYSATTSGSTFDEAARLLTGTRWVPQFRFISNYCDNEQYIAALATTIRELWQREGEPDRLLFSYHGIPQRYYDGGDPYPCHCYKTSRLVAERLGLSRERYLVTFQSVFGREAWIKPATIDTIATLPSQGVRALDVICPGFSADCLETIEEIDVENRHAFMSAGGKSFRYIPALNARPDHIAALADVIETNARGWFGRSTPSTQRESAAAYQNIASRR